MEVKKTKRKYVRKVPKLFDFSLIEQQFEHVHKKTYEDIFKLTNEVARLNNELLALSNKVEMYLPTGGRTLTSMFEQALVRFGLINPPDGKIGSMK